MRRRIATVWVDQNGRIEVCYAMPSCVVAVHANHLDVGSLFPEKIPSWSGKCLLAASNLRTTLRTNWNRCRGFQSDTEWKKRCANVATGLRKRVHDTSRRRKRVATRKPFVSTDWKTKCAHSAKRHSLAKRNAKARKCPWVTKCTSVRHNMSMRCNAMGKSAASHRELFEMLEAQEYKCNLTGEQLTCSKEEGDNSVCDHIVPV